jgi:hypothetical protein
MIEVREYRKFDEAQIRLSGVMLENWMNDPVIPPGIKLTMTDNGRPVAVGGFLKVEAPQFPDTDCFTPWLLCEELSARGWFIVAKNVAGFMSTLTITYADVRFLAQVDNIGKAQSYIQKLGFQPLEGDLFYV